MDLPNRRITIFTITVDDDDVVLEQRTGSTTTALPLSQHKGHPVGLRILIQNQTVSTSTHEYSNIVDKVTLRQAPRRTPAPLSFLDACYLCKKTLSPEEDVYMYRGDRAFCSSDCRCTQILRDERSELKASLMAPPKREEWRSVPVLV